MTGNAELQTSAFPKDDTCDQCVLKLACFGKGRQDCVFWGSF